MLRTDAPAEAAASVTPANYAYEPGNIRRYGTRWWMGRLRMIRRRSARRSMRFPLGGGRIFCVPPGVIMVKSVVYIPQRVSGFGGAGGTGTVLDFDGCTFDGNGVPDLRRAAPGYIPRCPRAAPPALWTATAVSDCASHR